MTQNGRLLLVLPLPFRREKDGAVMVESQAANGLDLWAENFDEVTLAAPLGSADQGDQRAMLWTPVDELRHRDRIHVELLPEAYGMAAFARAYAPTRRRLGALIDGHQYLSFALAGLTGDWALVAAREARRKGRPYSIWTDIVNHTAILVGVEAKPLPNRLKARLMSKLMEGQHIDVINKSALGLFHGADCFEAYSPYCANSHLVHDIHLKPADQIDEARLQAKLRRTAQEGALKLVYVGRASEEKGPLDWLGTLKLLHEAGAPFEAAWYGGGPMLEEMRTKAAEWGLADSVSLPGFLADRGEVLDVMRDADIFMFCHLTQESPRCLIEGLKSGAPIIGYGNAFARDLAKDGGGDFAPVGDRQALANLLLGYARDRKALARKIEEAAAAGAELDDVKVFRHRSELIKEYC